MKTTIIKYLLLTSIVVVTYSCKKEYTCSCNKTYTRANGTTITESDGLYTFDDSKVRAAERCNQQEGSGSDLSGEYTRDCELK